MSLLLSIVMLFSMIPVIATAEASAAETETATTSAVTSADSFSWDNASVYFLLTDRFENGNTANDHSYNRLINKDGSVVTSSQLNSTAATFHGGDFKGITNKIEQGYFDDLGVNALWISAPYEQIHGYVIVGEGKSDSVKHYAYHGYYAMDYTQTDANFGTAQEFKEMVDTAHEHGIRIVLDIVMNHPGYNTIYDMYEYNYGAFMTTYGENYAWDQYYNWKSNANYHRSIDYNSSNSKSGWARWWGPDWLRCGIAGYTPFGGDDLTKSAGGDLPDFLTESSKTVNVPTFLQEKWKKEGRYNEEMNDLNTYFAKGKSKTVRNYLVAWLSEWVRDYGIDGFRCDTAKHVELASWKALSDECTQALKDWRAANKGKTPAASWTDDFWMTAEDYGSGVNKDAYFTQGGFDSKINFSFTGGGGVPNASSINNTYADYANKINNDPNFNVLSYISSHDTALCRGDLIYQGSAFQLMPGAIQIFYGDETARPYLNDKLGDKIKDHQLRSDMNWNSIDQTVLKHWQKVGQFRNNHVAVGAGTHKAITATSGTAFVREYNKNGVNDTVFACIAANKNTNVTLTVGSYVSDGTLLKNTYDDKTATVSGGKVTFNSGANGTILVEVAGASTAPDVSVSHTGGNFSTDTLSITASLNEYATSGTYQIGNAAAVKFTGSKTITIGADMAFDESVTIKFTATDGTDTKERSYTYTKVDPNATPFKFPTERTTYLVDTASWGKANCYAWITGGSNNGQWPGLAMTKVDTFEGKDVYSYEVPASMNNVIFN
ncbi:MAG: alpha-amylase family glycosyl hydrolase, partial [Eubacteriales bacterium]|nr:alpha-amylase family glycosyl hydrolase [Eubacteriales bacterium]